MALKRNLMQGISGSDVKEMQNALIMLGYSVGSSGADGQFGSATATAVSKFQQDNGLQVDGILGLNTYNALTQALVKKGVIAPTSSQTSMPAPVGSGGEVVLHGGASASVPASSQETGFSWTTIGLIAAGVIALLMFSDMGEGE